MKLGERQRLFVKLLPRLIDFAYEQGYELTVGDAFRDHRLHGKPGVKMGYGHPNSNHKNKLAIDLNLFKAGVFMETSEAHTPLGEFWEKLHPLCRWGGRFNDGNHYSIESPEGMK